MDWDDPTIVLPTLFGGVFWPLAIVVLLVLYPIATMVGPAILAWFTAPAHKAEKEGQEHGQ